MFILDCCFSELVIHTLIPLFWLAPWSIVDIIIGHLSFLENYLICVSMGAFLAIVTYTLQVSCEKSCCPEYIKLLLVSVMQLGGLVVRHSPAPLKDPGSIPGRGTLHEQHPSWRSFYAGESKRFHPCRKMFKKGGLLLSPHQSTLTSSKNLT